MKYTVVWTPTAEQDLAAIWMKAGNRDAVTGASSTIDALLERDPVSQGKSRYDTVRVMFEPPLGVDFDVSEDDRLVYVLAVWYIEKSKSSS
jgi:plasmid stabilization system protein ParE